MYKTIIVHVDGGAGQDGRLRAAAQLAREYDAHLVGCAATGTSWFDYAVMSGSAGAPAPLPGSDFEGLREQVRERLAVFEREAARLGVASFETRALDDDAGYALMLESRYADLVVLSRDGTVDAESGMLRRGPHLPEFVALNSARPVLVVPPDYLDAAIGGKAVVGWDGGAQAVRAIGAALPLLSRATGVQLALINPERRPGLHGEQPGAAMVRYLARHGVQADVVCERTTATDGEALLKLALAAGAGLLVTGAYGHSRLREWVLGGVTRELLERTSVPLLIAH
jgi:nucleotide-binding universal stress UspA family protein